MSPKVSVIVPVYNAEEYLGECLDSILMQTLEDIEVICVDDGSTDDSLSCLQGYTFLDSRLKVIHQENSGAGSARNRGLKEATGEFIIFLNADDFFELNMLEKMVTKAEETKADVTVCGNYVFDAQLKRVSQTSLIEEKYLKQPFWIPKELSGNLFAFCSYSPWNKLIRTDIVRKNGLKFDETSPSNCLMFHCLVLACSHKISMMKDAFVYHRVMVGRQFENQKGSVAFISKTLTNTYKNLKKLDLYDIHQQDFWEYVRKNLQIKLANCNAHQKRKELLSIRENLQIELYNQIFSTPYPAISLIIPAYNAAKYLPQCLESALNQTLKNIEVICVDDGSTDDTLEVLNKYAEKDRRIQVIHQENLGQAMARNVGMKRAKGVLIQFLDSDDYLELDACECIYTYMLLFDLEICQIAAIEFKNDREFENPYNSLKWLPEDFPPVFCYDNLLSVLSKVAMACCLTIYRRDFLTKNKINWIQEHLCSEDMLFFTEAFLKTKRMGALSDRFYHRRVHPLSITQNRDTNLKNYVKIVRYILNMIPKINHTKTILMLYVNVFLLKTWFNFGRLSPQGQVAQAPYVYDLFFYIVKKYFYPLPQEISKWCLIYAKSKGKKEVLRLKFYLLLAKLNRSDYTINLLQIIRKPEFIIKIFNIPIFRTNYIINLLNKLKKH